MKFYEPNLFKDIGTLQVRILMHVRNVPVTLSEPSVSMDVTKKQVYKICRQENIM